MATNSLIFVALAFITFKVCAMESASIHCGTTTFTRELITVGTRTFRGQWPFLTALFLARSNTFFCGGTLISSKHVLTAAHCIQGKYSSSTLLPGNISVLLGAYDLTSNVDSDVQQRLVKEIHVHPEWIVDSQKYDADLAILLLSEIVSYTNFIRPVCLSAEDTAFDNVTGSVVGWGHTETQTGPNKEFIKHAFVTALNGYYCVTEHPDVAPLSSTRTFCGRGVNGNANQGDSGGGVYVLHGSAWVLYGIVSAMRSDATGFVDVNAVVVYSNVLKFKKWIVDTVSQSGATVGEAQTDAETKITLECDFWFTDGVGENDYGCWVDNLDIRDNNTAVASFTGSHLNKKTNQDVEWIQFRNGTMFFIPSGIGHIFRNLKKLEVGRNLGKNRISRSEFKSLENLVDLVIKRKVNTTLDYDSLRDLERLEKFVCVDSLTEIDGTIFQTNVKLRVVNLFDNKIEILPRQLFTRNVLLETVDLHSNSLTIIDGTTFETNVKLRKVWLYDNKIEVLPRNLFARNLQLEIVSLSRNSLKTIDIDFTPFGYIKGISLTSNICIDAHYSTGVAYKLNRRWFTNISEFQNLLRNSCSSDNA